MHEKEYRNTPQFYNIHPFPDPACAVPDGKYSCRSGTDERSSLLLVIRSEFTASISKFQPAVPGRG